MNDREGASPLEKLSVHVVAPNQYQDTQVLSGAGCPRVWVVRGEWGGGALHLIRVPGLHSRRTFLEPAGSWADLLGGASSGRAEPSGRLAGAALEGSAPAWVSRTRAPLGLSLIHI